MHDAARKIHGKVAGYLYTHERIGSVDVAHLIHEAQVMDVDPAVISPLMEALGGKRRQFAREEVAPLLDAMFAPVEAPVAEPVAEAPKQVETKRAPRGSRRKKGPVEPDGDVEPGSDMENE